MAGPLNGVRIVELASIGPAPFAAMLLADLGAEVIRICRADSVEGPAPDAPHGDITLRGRRNIAVDLKDPDGVATALQLIDRADALVEGYRPGVAERLGLGPDVCRGRNPRLVYGRMTGWGQDGPYAHVAGHDINFISLAGVLAHLRRPGEVPHAPLNLVGDFGGGGMYLALGVTSALLETRSSGLGQVIDVAMVDGAASLSAFTWAWRNLGLFDSASPGTSLLDGGAPFYESFECADGGFVSVGAIEPQFYADLLDRLGLADDPDFAADQLDRERWSLQKDRLRAIFLSRTRAEWCAELELTDVCFAPVLTMEEAVAHPHNVARGTFVEVAGVLQPAPAPRFSRTPAALGVPPAHAGQHSREILLDWGVGAARVDDLLASGAVVDSSSAP